MGILADYIRRKWSQADQAAIAEGAQGLLGEAGWEQMGPFQAGSQGAMMQEQRGYGPMIGGSGLLGGEGMMDPTNRAKFAVGLMGLPGMQNEGAGMLGQQMSTQDQTAAAMQRWMIEQQMKQQRRVGPYESEQQYQSTVNPISTAYEKAIAPQREVLSRLNQTAQTIQERGGFDKLTGADDMVMLRNFIKMTVPNEAVMSDDQRAATLAANGYPGQAAAFLQLLKGKGSLDAQGRATLFQTMQSLGQSALPQYQDIRQQYEGRAQRGSIDPRDFMRPAMGLPGGFEQPGAAQAGQIDRPQQLSAPGVPFEYPDSPTGWATYDEQGNIIVYEVD